MSSLIATTSVGLAVVGYVLIVLGIVTFVVGLIGAARALLADEERKLKLAAMPPGWTDIIGALLKAGPWGIVMAAGLGLIAAGLGIVAPNAFTDPKGGTSTTPTTPTASP
jgi:hypothetical protein